MKIALIQLNIAFGRPEKNKLRAEKMLREALESNPDVVVFPELWTTGYDLENLQATADPDGSGIRKLAGKWAADNKINIVAGSTARKTDDGIYNTLSVFDRSGACIKEYSKVHLFRLMREHLFLKAGNSDGRFAIDGIPAAGFICYDIRFPEWIRKQVLLGAKVLFIPAEWPEPRLDHWRTLLTCRAIENQAFVVACNRSGSDPENTFAGHSMVISPWGEVIAEAGADEHVLTADIDLSAINDVRSRIPVFEDRRPELY